MKFLRNVLALSSALALCLALQGCLTTNSNNSTVSGANISSETFAQITPGKTKDFVVSLIGQPSSKVSSDAGIDVWSWRYNEKKSSNSGFIFIFMSSNVTNTTTVRHVEFKDNVVTRTWTD